MVLSQASSRVGKRGREEGRGEYSKKCCVLCAGAALLPAEMRTTNFIHFFEIARVAPINRQVCAITGKPRPAACCWWVQKAKEVDEHLATCSRFTPDLHFGAAALQEAAAFNARDRNSLTRLGWVPALPRGGGVCHAQQQLRGTCGIRQPKLHPCLLSPLFPYSFFPCTTRCHISFMLQPSAECFA